MSNCMELLSEIKRKFKGLEKENAELRKENSELKKRLEQYESALSFEQIKNNLKMNSQNEREALISIITNSGNELDILEALKKLIELWNNPGKSSIIGKNMVKLINTKGILSAENIKFLYSVVFSEFNLKDTEIHHKKLRRKVYTMLNALLVNEYLTDEMKENILELWAVTGGPASTQYNRFRHLNNFYIVANESEKYRVVEGNNFRLNGYFNILKK